MAVCRPRALSLRWLIVGLAFYGGPARADFKSYSLFLEDLPKFHRGCTAGPDGLVSGAYSVSCDAAARRAW